MFILIRLIQRRLNAFDLDDILSSINSSGKGSSSKQPPTTSSNRFANTQRNNNKDKTRGSGGGGHSHHSRARNEGPKKQQSNTRRFNNTSGSTKQQEALKSQVELVHKYRRDFKVQFIDPTTNKMEIAFLPDIVNPLDLSKQGIYVVEPQEAGGLPLIKLNTCQEMVKQYADKLAEKMQKELLNKGSSAAWKAALLKEKAQKRSSTAKVVTVSWTISLSDLANQKKSEVEKIIKKGGKFSFFIGDRSNARAISRGYEGNDASNRIRKSEAEDYQLEIARRTMVLNKVTEMLDELSCLYEAQGGVEGRVILQCSPKVEVTSSKSAKEADQSSSKELRKQKKSKVSSKSSDKQKIEDLDSLYLFKIDDD
ncbi:Altered inheritance of mitochondria protein 23, mitochondrial [Scheffersomyces spartinae]|uniref:Altered inheritance of mitochondria protein 23, mitochondrial n=1 Tax=Scheffersomyces spartinae TaxID=45513 RepID=A0A9P7V5D6_9ASCO|nr:Altered inheritance of mitochondria protein 23, mitochondrial [Scheffersomyces spartinae]KAG7191582.1 Altered inheritance of mitochondria protein 23, mitochondrial [Scheffersomyces spartinae]